MDSTSPPRIDFPQHPSNDNNPPLPPFSRTFDHSQTNQGESIEGGLHAHPLPRVQSHFPAGLALSPPPAPFPQQPNPPLFVPLPFPASEHALPPRISPPAPSNVPGLYSYDSTPATIQRHRRPSKINTGYAKPLNQPPIQSYYSSPPLPSQANYLPPLPPPPPPPPSYLPEWTPNHYQRSSFAYPHSPPFPPPNALGLAFPTIYTPYPPIPIRHLPMYSPVSPDQFQPIASSSFSSPPPMNRSFTLSTPPPRSNSQPLPQPSSTQCLHQSRSRPSISIALSPTSPGNVVVDDDVNLEYPISSAKTPSIPRIVENIGDTPDSPSPPSRQPLSNQSTLIVASSSPPPPEEEEEEEGVEPKQLPSPPRSFHSSPSSTISTLPEEPTPSPNRSRPSTPFVLPPPGGITPAIPLELLSTTLNSPLSTSLQQQQNASSFTTTTTAATTSTCTVRGCRFPRFCVLLPCGDMICRDHLGSVIRGVQLEKRTSTIKIKQNRNGGDEGEGEGEGGEGETKTRTIERIAKVYECVKCRRRSEMASPTKHQLERMSISGPSGGGGGIAGEEEEEGEEGEGGGEGNFSIHYFSTGPRGRWSVDHSNQEPPTSSFPKDQEEGQPSPPQLPQRVWTGLIPRPPSPPFPHLYAAAENRQNYNYLDPTTTTPLENFVFPLPPPPTTTTSNEAPPSIQQQREEVESYQQDRPNTAPTQYRSTSNVVGSVNDELRSFHHPRFHSFSDCDEAPEPTVYGGESPLTPPPPPPHRRPSPPETSPRWDEDIDQRELSPPPETSTSFRSYSESTSHIDSMTTTDHQSTASSHHHYPGYLNAFGRFPSRSRGSGRGRGRGRGRGYRGRGGRGSFLGTGEGGIGLGLGIRGEDRGYPSYHWKAPRKPFPSQPTSELVNEGGTERREKVEGGPTPEEQVETHRTREVDPDLRGKFPVVKVENIPFGTTYNQIETWLPTGVLPPEDEVPQPIHIILHRLSGRTLPHCYVEVCSFDAAIHLLTELDRTIIGNRTVRVKMERSGELMRDLFDQNLYFPFSPDAINPAAAPLPHLPPEGFKLPKTLFTDQDLEVLVRMLRPPPWADIGHFPMERPYTTIGSIISKFPWNRTDLWTNSLRDALVPIVSRAIAQAKKVRRDLEAEYSAIAARLIAIASHCPGFTPAQRARFARDATPTTPKEVETEVQVEDDFPPLPVSTFPRSLRQNFSTAPSRPSAPRSSVNLRIATTASQAWPSPTIENSAVSHRTITAPSTLSILDEEDPFLGDHSSPMKYWADEVEAEHGENVTARSSSQQQRSSAEWYTPVSLPSSTHRSPWSSTPPQSPSSSRKAELPMTPPESPEATRSSARSFQTRSSQIYSDLS